MAIFKTGVSAVKKKVKPLVKAAAGAVSSAAPVPEVQDYAARQTPQIVKPQVATYQPQIQQTPQIAKPQIATYNPTPAPTDDPNKLTPPGQLTEAGKMYEDRVKQGLLGDDPRVQNAQAREETAASRRQYMGRTGTEEALAQSGFTPGTPQYQRALMESQAKTDSANLEGSAQVNEYARQTGQENLERAKGLEEQQYNRSTTERSYKDTKELLGKTDTSSLIGSVTDPKAKNFLLKVQAEGGDVNAAFAEMYEGGTLKQEYRSQTPVQNIRSDAEDWIKATQPGLQPGTPEYDQAVVGRMSALDKAQQGPVNDAQEERERRTATESVKVTQRRGESMTAEQFAAGIDSGDVENYALDKLPIRGKIKAGTTIGIGGTQYKVLGDAQLSSSGKSGNRRHRDVMAVETADGKIMYVNSKGPTSGSLELTETPPVDVSQGTMVWDATKKQFVVSG